MNALVQSLVDFVFPPGCAGCGLLMGDAREAPLCPACLNKIKLIASPICRVCGLPFASLALEDHLCGDCTLQQPSFSLARAWGCYETLLMEAIHQFKYQRKTLWGKVFGTLMAETSYPGLSFSEYSVIVAVPLHKKRLRQRGYNQAMILARQIARFHRLPLEMTALKRQIHTREQTRLGKKERENNLKGAFCVKDSGRFKGENIILIDDVYTTGSTVKECSQTLMEHQAAGVAVLTLARAL